MECSHEKEWNVPVFGPQSVFVLSTDNKKDTTWNHSSNKANPMFMDMSSEVMPDHNFAIAPIHKIYTKCLCSLCYKNGKYIQ